MTLRDDYKLTWLALAEDHAALSRSLEQLMALPRSVKVKRVLLVSLAAKFLVEAFSVRAIAKVQFGGEWTLHERRYAVIFFAICPEYQNGSLQPTGFKSESAW